MYQDLIPFWDAFNTLTMSRSSGFGVGAIPLSEVKAYLDINEIYDVGDRLEFTRWIRFLDGVYLKLVNNKRENESKSKNPTQK